MQYVATINLDYSGTKHTEYQKLLVALEYAGWEYVETSAMIYRADDLDGVRRALALLAKALHLGGNLSALNLQVQAIRSARKAPTARSRPNAYREVMAQPSPPEPKPRSVDR